MTPCMSCLEHTQLHCIYTCGTFKCENIIALCKDCYITWPIFSILKLNGYVYSRRCSINCLLATMIYHMQLNFKIPNILINHQKEILRESRKHTVKSLINE